VPPPPPSHSSPTPPTPPTHHLPCTPIHSHPLRASLHFGLPRPQAFKVQKHLEYHMLLHSQPDAFACPDCGKNFSNPCGSTG
jgi:hypothetical protein